MHVRDNNKKWDNNKKCNTNKNTKRAEKEQTHNVQRSKANRNQKAQRLNIIVAFRLVFIIVVLLDIAVVVVGCIAPYPYPNKQMPAYIEKRESKWSGTRRQIKR